MTKIPGYNLLAMQSPRIKLTVFADLEPVKFCGLLVACQPRWNDLIWKDFNHRAKITFRKQAISPSVPSPLFIEPCSRLQPKKESREMILPLRIRLPADYFLCRDFRRRERILERRYNLRMQSQRARARKIILKLRQAYGEPAWNDKPPVDELISTVLSQNTNDANRDKAFTALRKRFPTWEDVLNASTADVVAAIHPAGLGPQKGPRIRAILQTIQAERGRIELDFLRGLPPEKAREWLMRLPGVGPKTAAIVMQFALGMPAFPVDTHVYRVTGRLGLRAEKLSLAAAHEHLAQLFAPEAYASAHLNLIRLGREVCRARTPDCPRCPVRGLCPYYRRLKTTVRKP
jgi:endonuclease-3